MDRRWGVAELRRAMVRHVDQFVRAFDLAQLPARYGKDGHCDRAGVVAEPLPCLQITFMAALVERPFAVDSRVKKVAGIIADDAEAAVGDAGFHGASCIFGFAQER